jgi:hypothetical protein
MYVAPAEKKNFAGCCNYHNFGHYPLSYSLFKNMMLRRLDSASVFSWNLLRWAKKVAVCFRTPATLLLLFRAPNTKWSFNPDIPFFPKYCIIGVKNDIKIDALFVAENI